MHYINIETWERKDMLAFFSTYELPRFNLTFSLDVTLFYQHVKARQQSFYLSLMHCLVSQMNRIENFQYRMDEKGVYLKPIDHVSFTDKMQDGKRFKMVSTPFLEDRDAFIKLAQETSLKQGDIFFNPNAERELSTVYVTSFPWGKFLGFTHATKLGPKDSVPRLSWSQFVVESDKKILTVSIEVHHAFVDGYHVGLWLQYVQQELNI